MEKDERDEKLLVIAAVFGAAAIVGRAIEAPPDKFAADTMDMAEALIAEHEKRIKQG